MAPQINYRYLKSILSTSEIKKKMIQNYGFLSRVHLNKVENHEKDSSTKHKYDERKCDLWDSNQ